MPDISEQRILCADHKCKRLIAKGSIGLTGIIYIKCSCKKINRISANGVVIVKEKTVK